VGNLVHISIGKHDFFIFLSHRTCFVVVIFHFTEAVQEDADASFLVESGLQMRDKCNSKKSSITLSSLVCKPVLRY